VVVDVCEAVVERQHHPVAAIAGVQGRHGVVEGGHGLVGQGVGLCAELLRAHVQLVARAAAHPVVDEQGRAGRATPRKDRQPPLHELTHGDRVRLRRGGRG
jgi:hypothetical protein